MERRRGGRDEHGHQGPDRVELRSRPLLAPFSASFSCPFTRHRHTPHLLISASLYVVAPAIPSDALHVDCYHTCGNPIRRRSPGRIWQLGSSAGAQGLLYLSELLACKTCPSPNSTGITPLSILEKPLEIGKRSCWFFQVQPVPAHSSSLIGGCPHLGRGPKRLPALAAKSPCECLRWPSGAW